MTKWTPEMHKQIKILAPTHTQQECVDALNQQFNTHITINMLKDYIKRHEDVRHVFNRPHVEWTQEKIDFIKENAKNYSTKDFVDILNIHFKTNISHKSLKNFLMKHPELKCLFKKINKTKDAWTADMYAFIIENASKYYKKEFVEVFNQRFNTNITINNLNYFIRQNEITNNFKKTKHTNDNPKRNPSYTEWTDEMIAFAKTYTEKDCSTKEFKEEFNKVFHTNYSLDTFRHILNKKLNIKRRQHRKQLTEKNIQWLKDNISREKTLDECLKEFNQTLKEPISRDNFICTIHRLREKGHDIPQTKECYHYPIGTIMKRHDNWTETLPEYIYIKVTKNKKDKNWMRYDQYIYEQYYGPLSDDECIVFLNGDTLDCRIENLQCISKSDNRILKRQKLINKNPKLTELAIKNIQMINKLKTMATTCGFAIISPYSFDVNITTQVISILNTTSYSP